MERDAAEKELWKLLRPFIKEHPLKKDTVTEENVEDLIAFAFSSGIEEKMIAEVKAHPDGVFWDFLRLIPVKTDDDFSDDDDDDEDDDE